MRILLVTEELTARPSEGQLVFVMHLCRFLKLESDLTALYARGDPEPGFRSLRIISQRTLLTWKLLKFLKGETFDVIVYIPSSGLTGFGLLRGMILRTISKTPTILIALQERPVGRLHAFVSKFKKPNLVLTPSRELERGLERLNIKTDFLIPGYDDEVFKPVTQEEKRRLKAKFDLPLERFIVLHAGHIRETRNIGIFLGYREWGTDIQPVIKAGEVDSPWRDRLRHAGITVIEEHLENIHELFQAADCYLFPVSCPIGALEFPLSVVEALGCNLPVLSTPFGALPGLIDEGGGMLYFNEASEIGEKLSILRRVNPATSEKAEGFSWKAVFGRYLAPHLRSIAGRGEGAKA